MPDHAYAVAAIASDFARHFDGQSIAEVLGLLHDLGKYSDASQKRIAGGKKPVDHSTAGAQEACKRYSCPYSTIMAYPIAGHHTGLANGRVSGKRSSLYQRLELETEPIHQVWEDEITLPDVKRPEINQRDGLKNFQLAFFCRMLFSCLVDADHLETKHFYEGTTDHSKRSPKYPGFPELRKQLADYLDSMADDSPVNKARRHILDQVCQRAGYDAGNFTLTVPTGGGKTLTSLAFAMDHALTHGKDRIIYVAPFTSIIEQNAAIFREAIEPYGSESVLEHHGNFDSTNSSDKQTDTLKSDDKLKCDSENWDAPIIVTTAVQFFESLFAAKPSRCRKLHNIANSVVILDEAQTLPLGLLRPSVAALQELTLNYRTSVVYCTATQPTLNETHDGALPEAVTNIRELAPDPDSLFDDFKRVRVDYIQTQSDDAIVERLLAHEQILCVVNNRRHARYLFNRIKDEPGSFHLTTAMYPRHRRKVLAKIHDYLNKGKPCRLISTSLIEAGVDIDFPQVLRAEAGLESIAQAAGRCNREGKWHLEDSQVSVFEPENKEWTPPPELRRYAQVMRETIRHHGHNDLLSPAVMDHYFSMLYRGENFDGLDRKEIMPKLAKKIERTPFEDIETLYRLIEDNQKPVIIPNHEADSDAKQAISELEYTNYVGDRPRRLQQYSVPVPKRGFKALLEAGAITYIRPDVFGEDFAVLVNDDLYGDRSGLNWDEPNYRKSEKMIW